MEINTRRTFVKQITTGLLTGIFLQPFNRLFAAHKTELDYPDWLELVEQARWCPSVHNLQPHQIKVISANEAELYYNPARLLPVGDPDSIFATVALGVFIEHLSIAASSHGMWVRTTEVFDPVSIQSTGPTLFAKLKILPQTRKEEISPALFKKRMTAREQYNGQPLSETTLEKIKKEANRLRHGFDSSSEEEFIQLMIDLNQQTLFEDLQSEADRKELNALFRYSAEEAETKKDGLWAKCMGFSGSLMKSVFIHHEKWEKGARKKMLSKHYKASFKGTSTLCWFTGKFDNTEDWLNAGHMLARTWLKLTEDGAYIQPFGSLITNKGANAKINEKIGPQDDSKKMWLIFRAGYSKEPTRSYRLDTDQIIIS
jgi:hypothetical protein